MKRRWPLTLAFCLVVAAAVSLPSPSVLAQDVSQLEANAKSALDKLVSTVPAAKTLKKDAVAILVFPRVTRVGLVFGGQYGEGVLFRDGKPAGYYSTVGGSWGLQAGAQRFGYAMFFMTEAALSALTNSSGFEIGVGPSVVVFDQGTARAFTSMTSDTAIYAFVFSQRGLMAGAGIQGNRISRVSR
jgi:lipid-binding SYLF domain-containing protein